MPCSSITAFPSCLGLVFFCVFMQNLLWVTITQNDTTIYLLSKCIHEQRQNINKKDSNLNIHSKHLLWGLPVTYPLILSFSPGAILCLHTFSRNVKKETCPWSWFCYNLKILSCLKFCNGRLCPVMLIDGVRRFSKSEAWKLQTFEADIPHVFVQKILRT